jgi:hypothetical protein
MLSDAMGAMWRALTGPSADVAIVPTGWPTNWFRGKVLIQVTADGYLVRSVKPWPTIFKAMGVYSRGVKVALRLAMKSPGIRPLPAAPAWNPKVAPVATERAEPVTA